MGQIGWRGLQMNTSDQSGNKVAIIIPNCNTPEFVEELIGHVRRKTADNSDYDVYVINNGEPRYFHDKPENYVLSYLVPLGMGTAVIKGINYANRIDKYFAYWILTTSMKFTYDEDYLTPMLKVLKVIPDAVMIHPATIGTAWDSLEPSNYDGGIRGVWGVDSNAVLIRADWYNSVGGYDPELTFGWGSSLELCWKARRDGKRIYVDDRFLMFKDDGVAWDMGRRSESTHEEFNEKASKQMSEVLSKKYGEEFLERLGHEYR